MSDAWVGAVLVVTGVALFGNALGSNLDPSSPDPTILFELISVDTIAGDTPSDVFNGSASSII